VPDNSYYRKASLALLSEAMSLFPRSTSVVCRLLGKMDRQRKLRVLADCRLGGTTVERQTGTNLGSRMRQDYRPGKGAGDCAHPASDQPLNRQLSRILEGHHHERCEQRRESCASSSRPPARNHLTDRFLCTGGLLLTPFVAQAASVNISLGQTAQNMTYVSLGPNASGLGQYFIIMGACTPAGGNTTCVLSGAFTGTVAGFTSGTYSLVTTYVGTGTTPLQIIQKSVGANTIAFTSVPPTTTITLTLVTSNGNVVVPLFAGGQFVASTAFNFVHVAASETCSGTAVPSCSAAQVGLAAGAVLTGPITGGATFDIGNNYYFSDLAFKDGWQMTITYNNYSPQPVTCVTNFYGDSGAPLLVPFSQGTVFPVPMYFRRGHPFMTRPSQTRRRRSCKDGLKPLAQARSRQASSFACISRECRSARLA
jgi:hypothetical protein